MRPTEVTREEIIAAGQALQSAGRSTITGFALRQHIGGGNPSRLRQVWDDHLAQTRAPVEPVADLPVEVADEVQKVIAELGQRLSGVVTDLNGRAVRAAERRVTEVVRSATADAQQAAQELAEASAAVEELESELERTRTEAVRLQSELSECQRQRQAQAVELARTSEQLANEQRRSEQLAGELAEAKVKALDTAKLQGRIDALSEQNAQLLGRLDGARAP